jgi:hypothetical protein
MLFKRKWGGGGVEMVTKEEMEPVEDAVHVACRLARAGY